MQIQIYQNRTHKSAYIFLRVFTYKMAAEINWHRRGTKLRHCHAVYRRRVSVCPGDQYISRLLLRGRR